MKLTPTLISLTCPRCKGECGFKFYPENANETMGEIYQFITCTKCGGKGKFTNVVLAPVGYDGTSEIEIMELSVGYFNNQEKSGVAVGRCSACKWWGSHTDEGDEKRECQRKRNGILKHYGTPMFDYLDIPPLFYATFGCIHWESKEKT